MKRRTRYGLMVWVGALLCSTLAWADPPQRREVERQDNNRHDTERRSGERRDLDRREPERVEQQRHQAPERYESRGVQERGAARSTSPDERPGPRAYFHDDHRAMVRDYYGQTYREASHCPPGLAKKHNGCLPPGQARLWRRGYVLPREVIYYDLEPAVLMRLGPPPSGHRFVRVAGDILLIAIGTGLVIDAIEDLGR